ncbi:MAG: hypothetical protein K6T83_17020 [Alicyclobacillus sp.]|nr:hypothetical protein [Alicyclobacillus sp.]
MRHATQAVGGGVGERPTATLSRGSKGKTVGRGQRKREVKAAIPVDLAELVQSQANEHGMSVMAYVRVVSLVGLDDERVIRAMSPYYRRGYCVRDHAYFGTGADIDALIPEGDDVVRVSIRYWADEYERVAYLAYALGCSVSQAQTVLLAEAMRMGVRV